MARVALARPGRKLVPRDVELLHAPPGAGDVLFDGARVAAETRSVLAVNHEHRLLAVELLASERCAIGDAELEHALRAVLPAHGGAGDGLDAGLHLVVEVAGKGENLGGQAGVPAQAIEIVDLLVDERAPTFFGPGAAPVAAVVVGLSADAAREPRDAHQLAGLGVR